MTIGMWRAVRWALCGGAFVSVVAAASGCGMFRASKPVAATNPPNAVSQQTRPELFNNGRNGDQRAQVEAPPPSINIFGEFDGAAPLTTNSASEAGFQQHTFVDEGFTGCRGESRRQVDRVR